MAESLNVKPKANPAPTLLVRRDYRTGARYLADIGRDQIPGDPFIVAAFSLVVIRQKYRISCA